MIFTEGKITEIIRKDLEEQTSASITKLKAELELDTQAAIDRINGVYTSAVTALQELELVDASLLDIFLKTNGNVRVYKNVHASRDQATNLMVQTNFEQLGYDIDPVSRTYGHHIPYIELLPGKRYKVIVMAIEEKNE